MSIKSNVIRLYGEFRINPYNNAESKRTKSYAIFDIVNFHYKICSVQNTIFVGEFHCWNMNEKKMDTHLWIIRNLCWLHAMYIIYCMWEARSNLLISFFLHPNLVHGQFDIFTWLIVADRFEAVMHHHSGICWTQWSTMEHSEPNMKYWKMQRIGIRTHIDSVLYADTTAER